MTTTVRLALSKLDTANIICTDGDKVTGGMFYSAEGGVGVRSGDEKAKNWARPQVSTPKFRSVSGRRLLDLPEDRQTRK